MVLAGVFFSTHWGHGFALGYLQQRVNSIAEELARPDLAVIGPPVGSVA